MRAKLERIVKRAPEVMVKITGRTKSVEHLKSHLEYITRNGELTGETEQGALLVGRVGLKDLQSRWADDAALDNRRRRDGSLSVNVILSMPAGTDAAAVKDAARAFAIETFATNHDFVFVQHLEDKHPHVHLTVRSLGHDGKRLNPRKADLQVWRERFAGELRLRGIAAEATPRRTRGKSAESRSRRRAGVAQARRYSLCRSACARGGLAARPRTERRGAPWERQFSRVRRRSVGAICNYAAELERTGAQITRSRGRSVNSSATCRRSKQDGNCLRRNWPSSPRAAGGMRRATRNFLGASEVREGRAREIAVSRGTPPGLRTKRETIEDGLRKAISLAAAYPTRKTLSRAHRRYAGQRERNAFGVTAFTYSSSDAGRRSAN